MTDDNRQMWTDLGIDLERHDKLLNALGPIYQEIYLSQKGRPEGMGFFDFVVGDIHGIRVRELRQHAMKGGKVVATYCVFVPEEIVSLIARGEESSAIALGLHHAIATRIAGMVRRIVPRERIVFAGGGALNRCLQESISRDLGVPLTIPHEPQIVGALGAALLAERPIKD